MLTRFFIPSISIATILIGVKPAMAQSSSVSASSSTEAQAQATSNLSTDASASGVNISKIPLSTLKNAEEKEKVFSLTLGAERGSDTIADNSAADKTTTTFLISPAVSLTKNLTLLSETYIQQQENGPRNTEMTDTAIALSLKLAKWGEHYQPSVSLTGYAPTSEGNRKDTRFQGAGGAGFKIGASYPFMDSSYSISYRRNVHEFTVNSESKSNIRDVVSQKVRLDIPIIGKWSTTLIGLYKNSWTYQNSNRQAFSFDGDINFEATKVLSFNVGVSTEGSALKANGQDSNIQFYDDKSSVIRVGVTYVL